MLAVAESSFFPSPTVLPLCDEFARDLFFAEISAFSNISNCKRKEKHAQRGVIDFVMICAGIQSTVRRNVLYYRVRYSLWILGTQRAIKKKVDRSVYNDLLLENIVQRTGAERVIIAFSPSVQFLILFSFFLSPSVQRKYNLSSGGGGTSFFACRDTFECTSERFQLVVSVFVVSDRCICNIKIVPIKPKWHIG